jgi:hypothetical protein
MASLLHRADCHASGSVDKFAVVAIGELEPFNLCAHCLHKHTPRLIELGAIVERVQTLTPAQGTGTEATPSHYAGS